MNSRIVWTVACAGLAAGLILAAGTRTVATDKQKIANRGDVRNLPQPLRARLVELAGRPHTYPR